MRVYKTTDRVPVKIGDAVFTLSPLTRHQKQLIIDAAQKSEKGVAIQNAMEMAALSMKYSIKAVSGIKCFDGVEWSPKFDPDGTLSDDSIDDLFNIVEDSPLVSAMLSITNGLHTLSKIEGVVIKGDVAEKK